MEKEGQGCVGPRPKCGEGRPSINVTTLGLNMSLGLPCRERPITAGYAETFVEKWYSSGVRNWG